MQSAKKRQQKEEKKLFSFLFLVDSKQYAHVSRFNQLPVNVTPGLYIDTLHQINPLSTFFNGLIYHYHHSNTFHITFYIVCVSTSFFTNTRCFCLHMKSMHQFQHFLPPAVGSNPMAPPKKELLKIRGPSQSSRLCNCRGIQPLLCTRKSQNHGIE